MPTPLPLARRALVLALLAAAPPPARAECPCARAASTAPAAPASATTAEATPTPAPAPFAPSSLCAFCHSNASEATAMRDPRRREVSPFLLWSGTAMANAYRDPVWQAAVAAEVAAAPGREREIVATCIRCHAPMGARTLPPEQVSLALLEPGGGGDLTADGVSCAVCHRISAEGLGDASTFTGGFRLLDDDRVVGPHRDPFEMPMRHHTDYVPAYGAQILSSGLCGTCHTVITSPAAASPAAASPGAASAGVAFVEQAPYLEWRNSAFSRGADDPRGATCQACHVPPVTDAGERIETRIARHPAGFDFPPIDPRAPYGRHLLVGGNTLLPRLLAARAPPGGDAARPPFEAVAQAAERQLSTRTAGVEIEGARVRGGTLSFLVRVVNLTGHKLPTGHPSRRAWLRVRVRDAAGRVVFASGEHDRAGRILGARGAPLAPEAAGGPVHPHRAIVRLPDEVQVWESVMEDEGGAVTELLLRAARPRKDDRILPAGWSPDHPDAARTRPVGTDGDADFEAGRDGVRYELALPPKARAPLRIEATLLYQAVGARHAAELARGDSAPARSLAAALDRLGNAPATLAAATRSTAR
jgi:hypothetical protein